jgi:hypothetical protein
MGRILFRSCEWKVLQKIFGLLFDIGFWRRCKNSEMCELYDEYDIVKFIKLCRLRWSGHVIRTEESDPVKKVLFMKPGGSGDRRRGRPKLIWCDELEEDVAWVGCRNWRINAQSREQWRNIVEKVTSHPGMLHQWKRNKQTASLIADWM